MPRNPEADALKAFLIFTVILVHLYAAIPLEQGTSFIRFPLPVLITNYFMPLFIAIAGYFFRYTVDKAPLHTLVINKFTELIVPILLWNGSIGLITYYKDITWFSFPFIIYNTSYGKLWFLVATFASLSLIAAIHKICKANLFLFSVLILFSTIALHFLHAPDSRLFAWNFHVPYMLPFAALGFIAAKAPLLQTLTRPRWWFLISGCYLLLCTFTPANVSHWKTGTDLFNPDFSWQTIAWCSLYRDLLAFTGCIFIIPILRFIWLKLPVTPHSYIFSRQKHTCYLRSSILLH